MKKLFKFIFLILFVAGLLFVISVPIVNNITAKNVSIKLENTNLPQNTEYIESIHKADKLVGNGNGMQYFGAILIKSDLQLEQLQKYYKNLAENDYEYIVEEQESQDISFIEHGTLSFQKSVENEKYYIVYSWGNGNNLYEILDLRGH